MKALKPLELTFVCTVFQVCVLCTCLCCTFYVFYDCPADLDRFQIDFDDSAHLSNFHVGFRQHDFHLGFRRQLTSTWTFDFGLEVDFDNFHLFGDYFRQQLHIWQLPQRFSTTVTLFGNFHGDFRRRLYFLATRHSDISKNSRSTSRLSTRQARSPQRDNTNSHFTSRLSTRPTRSPQCVPQGQHQLALLHVRALDANDLPRRLPADDVHRLKTSLYDVEIVVV